MEGGRWGGEGKGREIQRETDREAGGDRQRETETERERQGEGREGRKEGQEKVRGWSDDALDDVWMTETSEDLDLGMESGKIFVR
jgi:hypothetical protein